MLDYGLLRLRLAMTEVGDAMKEEQYSKIQ